MIYYFADKSVKLTEHYTDETVEVKSEKDVAGKDLTVKKKNVWSMSNIQTDINRDINWYQCHCISNRREKGKNAKNWATFYNPWSILEVSHQQVRKLRQEKLVMSVTINKYSCSGPSVFKSGSWRIRFSQLFLL